MMNKILRNVKSPTVSLINTENIEKNITRVSWITDELATTDIYYGTTTPFSAGAIMWQINGPRLIRSHAIDLSELSLSTTYHYIISATNADGHKTILSPLSFTTSGN